jgi:hypothetical protein
MACLFCHPAQAATPEGGATPADTVLTDSTAGSKIEYRWTAPKPGQSNSLGTITINSQPGNEKIELPLTLEPVSGGLVIRKAASVSKDATAPCDLTFVGVDGAEVHVIVRPSLAAQRFVIDVETSSPIFSTLIVDSWPPDAGAEPVAVPYYSGSVVYLKHHGLFANAYLDWQNSNATLLKQNMAIYYPLTDGRRNALRERIVAQVSPSFDGVLPKLDSPASPYLGQLAGKIILDIWGQQSFLEVASELANLGDYGVRDCVVLIHDWQRSGYDNALPAHYPANAKYGGGEALRQAVSMGRKNGCYVGLHENYIDYYSNYERYTTAALARKSDNQFIPAWLNYLHVQSFSAKPTWFVKDASAQSPEIHLLYGTNASFLDVNSSVVPWWRVDMDANVAGAGMFSASRDGSADLWRFLRKTYGGPVFGEGKDHWFWSGMLDGIEAQFGAGAQRIGGEKAPLFVDFDLLTIHPKQVNHGMGYYERWVGPNEDIERTDVLDAYRMQEIAYGHAPYVGKIFWSDVPRVLLEQNLVSPVAKRYGTQTVSQIQYQVNGAWTDTNAAIKAQDWSRVQVRYANGDTIVANSKNEPLTWDGYQIPQYGWVARGQNLIAYTALRNGLIVDYSETADSYFANARNQHDPLSSGDLARPSVVAVQQAGNRSLAVQLQWQVLEETHDGDQLINFIHFTDAKGAIVFQGDRSPSAPTTQWKAGQTVRDDRFEIAIPPNVPDGVYSMKIGLYSKKTGHRYKLAAVSGGAGEYILGDLMVSNSGSRLKFLPRAFPQAAPDLRMNSKGVVVDFDTIRTDGMVSVTRDANNWVLRTYPRSRPVTVQFKADRLKPPAVVSCDPAGSLPPTVPSVVNGYWQVQMNGAKSCSWPAVSP